MSSIIKIFSNLEIEEKEKKTLVADQIFRFKFEKRKEKKENNEEREKPLVADLQSSSDLSHPSKARDNNGEIWEL